MTSEELMQLATANNEPEWFLQKRRMALDVMDELASPEIQRFDYHNWQMLPETTGIIPTKLASNKDYVLTDIFEAAKKYPELMQKYYMNKVIKVDENKFTAYHTAFLNNGIFLYVPKNTVVTEPIEVNIVQPADKPFVSHILIVAEENTQFSFIQKMTTDGDQAAVANCIVEIVAKDNSEIKYAAVDELGKNVTSYLSRRAFVGQNAYVDWSIGLMNDGNTIADFDTDLYGEGAHSEIKVVDITADRQQEGVNTRVTNYGKHSIGHINQRGVIMYRSLLVFNGIGNIINCSSGANS